MKTKLIFSLLFTLSSGAFAQSREEKIEALRNLVLSYDPRISFKVTQSPAWQAWAHSSHINFNTGLIDAFETDELIFIACHELGHIFGEVRRAQGGTPEGEADYFGGKCLVKEFGASSGAIVQRALEKLTKEKIDPEKARLEIAPVTNQGYPSKECRLLSALNGVAGLERPRCWYAPAL